MSTPELSNTDIYQAPEANVMTQGGELDKSSMFSPGGRAGRLRYFNYLMGFSFLSMLISTATAGLVAVFSSDSDVAAGIATGIFSLFYLAAFIFTLIFMIKRLHDLEWTGWLCLLSILPLINIILGLILLFAPGTSGPNKYGPPPQPSSGLIAILIGTLFFITWIGILAAIAIPAYQDYVERAQQIQQNQ